MINIFAQMRYYRELKEELHLCKRIRYGKNSNLVRYEVVPNPSKSQIKNLLLKIIRIKNVQ